jgi:hypothetical protein
MPNKKNAEDKERPEDLAPETDEEIEARVHRMLDPTLPDEEPDAEPATAPDMPAKSKKIAITHHQDSTETPTAPPVKSKKKTTSKSAADEEQVITAPPVPDDLKKTIEEANGTLVTKAASVTDETDEATEEDLKELGKVAADEVVEAPEPESTKEATTNAEDEEAELPEVLNDEATEKAIDDITAAESDELLAVEDEERDFLRTESEEKPRRGLGGVLRDFVHSKALRWLIFILLLGLIGAVGAIPTTRYYALNTAGVRSSASIKVIDQSTLQPLKDVKVQLGDQTVMTDSAGTATFGHLKLGTAGLVIQKRAFAPINETITVGWGSNPLGDRNLSPVGSQYSFTVTDFLSGKPMAKVAASAGDADAQSDDKGQIKLTLEHSSDPTVNVVLSIEGYRDEKITLDLSSKQNMSVKMVPVRKEVFISKRSGTYDLYSIDVDGKNEQLVLKGTGNERDDLALVAHPRDEVVALVSTRDGKRNKDGYLLSNLTIINLRDNTSKSIAQSEQIQIANWIGTRLVYVQVASGASAADPNRQRLMSYDLKTSDNRQLASSNYFNDVLTAGNRIYYAPSSANQPNGVTASLFRVYPDGSSKQTVLAQETWNLFRTAYDKIVISIPGEWYDYKLEDGAPTKLEGQPADVVSRVYVDSPTGLESLRVDNRDGKGVLLVYDVNAKSEKTLRTQSGLKNPVRWLSDRVIVYRVHTDQETADYALSLDGGEPVKLQDITDTGGVDKWYYY